MTEKAKLQMDDQPEPGQPNRAMRDGYAALAALLLTAALIAMVIYHFA